MAGDDYVFALSPAGRRMAMERAATVRYSGPVPVSLAAYTAAVRAQTAPCRNHPRHVAPRIFRHCGGDELLDALGPALISQRSIFLYGPSGTGKTTIAERLTRVYEDGILVPYAVEVDGQIITVGDPAVHEQLPLDGVAGGHGNRPPVDVLPQTLSRPSAANW